MIILDIKSRWNEVKGRLKQRYGVLSDEDLTLYLGREGDLICKLQKKLGMSKADVLKIIGEA
ncbi:general stress protein CsbD [Chryseosolibacter indicus]|uniref:General stress protein CsbD n=1 Tax=Chryseosolibacter indicus TaxID=2782351 RepID=A0ABS5VMT9_9BACT|nr:general stress protein CsbD [Chryseosolibacter indicus]MBT1702431.1 general stress protein CsbD [Chryseosolibacter indicus]